MNRAQNEFYAGGAGAAAATAPRRETHGRTIMAAE
jgi:hypothetical protein